MTLYQQISTFENLYSAFLKARLGKRIQQKEWGAASLHIEHQMHGCVNEAIFADSEVE